MNLKTQYKRLFEARVSSNDAKLLNEAADMQPVVIDGSPYRDREFQAGVEGNKLFISDSDYTKGTPIHVTSIDRAYIVGSSSLYAMYIYGAAKPHGMRIKIGGNRAETVLHAIAKMLGLANARQLAQKFNIKETDSEMDVS